MAQKATDPRTDEMKREMAEHFAEFESEYRSSEWANVVYEDEEVVLVEDTKGYEFDEWSQEFDDVDFSQAMHDLANQLVDRRWSATYPVVFDKLEDEGDNEARHVAVDPSDLEPGDEVVVQEVAGDDLARGTVEETKTEAGRYAVTIDTEDGDEGLGRLVRVWEQTGRVWTRVEEDENDE